MIENPGADKKKNKHVHIGFRVLGFRVLGFKV